MSHFNGTLNAVSSLSKVNNQVTNFVASINCIAGHSALLIGELKIHFKDALITRPCDIINCSAWRGIKAVETKSLDLWLIALNLIS